MCPELIRTQPNIKNSTVNAKRKLLIKKNLSAIIEEESPNVRKKPNYQINYLKFLSHWMEIPGYGMEE